MGKSFIGGSTSSVLSFNASVTSYANPVIPESSAETTEANTQIPFRTAGVISKLYLRVTANTITATSTFRIRKNGANGNSAVSIPSSTTGELVDSSGTDSISTGDTVNFQMVTGGSGTSLSYSISSAVYEASGGDTLSIFGGIFGTAGTTYADNATTRYWYLGGLGQSFTDQEAHRQTQVNHSGTWKGLIIIISANSRTTASTFRSRKNGGNGNQSVSITASTTGTFQDTSNTDTIAANDLLCYQIVAGASAENITIQYTGSEIASSNNKFTSSPTTIGDLSIAADTFTGFHGRGFVTTETDVSKDIQLIAIASNLWCEVATNTANGNTAITFRKNQADTTLTLSITSAVTGNFEDASNTVSLVATDEISIKATDNSSSGAVGLQALSVMFDTTAASASSSISPSPSASVSPSSSVSLSPSPSPSASVSPSSSISLSPSLSISLSPSVSASASVSPSSSISLSPSLSPSLSISLSPSASLSPSSSISASPSAGSSPSLSISRSPSLSISLSPSSSISASVSPSSSISLSPSLSGSLSPSLSPSVSASASPSPSAAAPSKGGTLPLMGV